MIETTLSALKHEEVKEPDIRTLGHMLTPSERLQAVVTPLQRLLNIDEDTYEEIVQVWAYSCLKTEKKYFQVHRVGKSGDKGRDVIAYYDHTLNNFDLFQCKHYDHELNYSDLFGEIGKLITYTFTNAYPVPKNYYIVSPRGLAQSFRDLLQNRAKDLKVAMLADWDNKVSKKVGKENAIKLDDKLQTYIESFDCGIIQEIAPLTFLDIFQDKGANYYFWYFGGGWNAIKKVKLKVPEKPTEEEQNYITHLYEAYSENAGSEINEDNITRNKKYSEHLTLSRSLFYSAEEIRLTSRQSTPPDSDEFDELRSQIKTFVGVTYSDDYPDGFAKVKKVVEKAGEYSHAPGLLIGQFLDSNAKQGICHHLSNDGELSWKIKE